MTSKEYIRRYKFDLRDIAPPGILSFEVEGKDISDAMDNLAKELGEDVTDISVTLDAAYVWNPVKKEWVPHRPWWEEEKEPYEWEKGSNPDAAKPTPCDVCGNVELNWDRGWWVSDEEWLRIVPEKWRNKTLCPWCFTKFALQQGYQYKVRYTNGIAFGVEKMNNVFNG
ncbi:unnamed protein product, partial [marine sediment metagenome]